MDPDWNDLKAFAAVLRHGSTGAAARALGVEQTTCARRIASLEDALGAPLFDRTRSGYRPNELAKALAGPAAALAQAAEEIGRVAETERSATRMLRITTEEILARTVLAPAAARFATLRPDVRVSLDVTSALRDLDAGEADLAVRSGPEPTDPTLVRRRLGPQPWAVYCAPEYERTPPRTLEDLRDHPFGAVEGVFLQYATASGLQVRHAASTFEALKALVAQGGCVAAMPRALGDAPPALQPCFAFDLPQSQSWLLYPERLRRSPDVRLMADLIVDAFAEAGHRASVGSERASSRRLVGSET